MKIDRGLIQHLLEQAEENPRLRQNYDLRTNGDDGGQRMLNALIPGTDVPIHRHPNSNESVLILYGKVTEVFYDKDGHEVERFHMDATTGDYGCVVPAGAWHTVEITEPAVIYEAKDGRYGMDGTETLKTVK